MDDFESFMREKIARLRAEADALEKTLKEFSGSRARASGGSRASSGATAGGFGAVLEALDAAGTEGLTLDEMIEAASRKGFTVNRNTLRSQLWGAKNQERVEQMEPGRYRSPRAQRQDVRASEVGMQGSMAAGTAVKPKQPAPPPEWDEIPF